jgi:hypothetical protein
MSDSVSRPKVSKEIEFATTGIVSVFTEVLLGLFSYPFERWFLKRLPGSKGRAQLFAALWHQLRRQIYDTVDVVRYAEEFAECRLNKNRITHNK